MKLGVGRTKENALKNAMLKYAIFEADIEEKFIRSSGRGGQHINKAATCVYLKHKRTGIEVKCQNERSQALNRYFARKRLVKKVEAEIAQKVLKARQEVEKARRQKRKRSKAAKEKMLKYKKKRSEKKKMRRTYLHIHDM